MSWINSPGRLAFFSQTAMHKWDVFWTTSAVAVDYGTVLARSSDRHVYLSPSRCGCDAAQL